MNCIFKLITFPEIISLIKQKIKCVHLITFYIYSFPLPSGPPQVLQSSDLPAGLVNIITGSRDQLTAALANHSVIKAIWYWGSAEASTTN